MIEIFRPAQVRNALPCKQCGKKLENIKESIVLKPHKANQERWNFHNECFVEFRKQITQVNIFRVKEK